MNTSPICFEITDGEDMVKVEIIGLINSLNYPDWQEQLLDINVTVKGCCMGGKFSAEFMPDDFLRFRKQLVSMVYLLDDTAIFEGALGYLKLRIMPADNGLFEVYVKACDVPGIGSELTFRVHMERSEVAHLIHQLDLILERYPAPLGRSSN